MDPIDRICGELSLICQAIGQYYVDTKFLLVFAGIIIVVSLVILHNRN